jgi:hypothetical protein
MNKRSDIRYILGVPAVLMLGVALVAGTAIVAPKTATWAWEGGSAFFGPGTAQAQTTTRGTQQTPAVGGISDDALQSYATAIVKVQKISDNAREKQQETDDAAARSAIQKDAHTKSIAAIKAEGLTVERYNQIARATETDPQLLKKVLDYVAQVKLN